MPRTRQPITAPAPSARGLDPRLAPLAEDTLARVKAGFLLDRAARGPLDARVAELAAALPVPEAHAARLRTALDEVRRDDARLHAAVGRYDGAGDEAPPAGLSEAVVAAVSGAQLEAAMLPQKRLTCTVSRLACFDTQEPGKDEIMLGGWALSTADVNAPLSQVPTVDLGKWDKGDDKPVNLLVSVTNPLPAMGITQVTVTLVLGEEDFGGFPAWMDQLFDTVFDYLLELLIPKLEEWIEDWNPPPPGPDGGLGDSLLYFLAQLVKLLAPSIIAAAKAIVIWVKDSLLAWLKSLWGDDFLGMADFSATWDPQKQSLSITPPTMPYAGKGWSYLLSVKWKVDQAQ